MDIKIFIGSSTERLDIAKWVKEIITEINDEFPEVQLSALGWWDVGAFPFGKSFYESLFENLEKTDAAVFVAGGEDLVVKRKKKELGPRDNIILEFGLVEGKKGRGRALLGITGVQTLPSDLEGINQLLFTNTDDKKSFKAKNKNSIKNWISQIVKDMQDSPPLATYFPMLYSSLLKTIKEYKTEETTFKYHEIDMLFSDILTLVTSSSDDNTYITSLLINNIKDELPSCKSILAIDVMGPKAWITPNAYRYLANQIIFYLRRNLKEDQWSPVISEQLYDEICQACVLLKSQYNMDQSLSGFNAQADFTFSKGDPKLEFARVLLWSKKELLSSLGDSVVAIHQAFNIPLFFKAVEPEEELRKLDFVIFEKHDGTVTGFYSAQSTDFKPQQFSNNLIPGKGNAKEQFYSLFKKNKLMLAIDARAILRENPAAELG